jgi:hypothetical protein
VQVLANLGLRDKLGDISKSFFELECLNCGPARNFLICSVATWKHTAEHFYPNQFINQASLEIDSGRQWLAARWLSVTVGSTTVKGECRFNLWSLYLHKSLLKWRVV